MQMVTEGGGDPQTSAQGRCSSILMQNTDMLQTDIKHLCRHVLLLEEKWWEWKSSILFPTYFKKREEKKKLVIFIPSPSSTNLERAADREPIHTLPTSNIGALGAAPSASLEVVFCPFFNSGRQDLLLRVPSWSLKQLLTLTVKLRC